MDTIELKGLRVYGHHGVLDHEQRDGQVFIIDLVVRVDLAAAAASDDLTDTIDYGALAQAVAAAVQATRFDLIEALAGHLAELVLADPRVQAVQVRVGKPSAPIPLDFAEVAVVLRRTR